MEISLFKNVFNNEDGGKISLEGFITGVKFGTWKKEIEAVRNETNKKVRQELKKTIPYVTPSGLFSRRNKDGLIKHSGFICIDIDEIDDVKSISQRLKADEYTYAIFASVSGNGVAVLFKIDPKKHEEAFIGIEFYLANKYHLQVDKACKDITRARFVSYDPDAYVNEKAEVFKIYRDKKKAAPAKQPRVITGRNDVDFILGQINARQLDLTNSSYFKYLEIGFAISEEYGEEGRTYFHEVVKYSAKYTYDGAEKQYNRCLKAGGSGVNFATFLHYCKEEGIQIVSNETRHISTVAVLAKKGGRGLHDALKVLVEVDGVDPETAEEIATKVYDREEIGDENKLSKLEQIEIFLNSNYSLKKNEITRFVENYGVQIDSNFLNTCYVRARKEIDDKVKFDEIERIIFSDFVPEYNPLKDWFEKRSHIYSSEAIRALCTSIETDTGFEEGSLYPEYKNLFVKKWLVGIIASIYGKHSPLLLALTGGQGTGKTEFFRRLFPEEFKPYYAESKLDAGKDDEILMCQKILILDDEFGGKSKMEAKRLKELTSKEYFTLREPYGRNNVRLRRMAVLAGTSNDDDILNDPTGNRRIIPLKILSIDFDKYNSVDKEMLLVEAYQLYIKGYDYHLTKEEVKILNGNTSSFEMIRPEKELLLSYIRRFEEADKLAKIHYLQATEIKVLIEKNTMQRFSVNKIGQELKNCGFTRISKKVDGAARWVYPVEILTNNMILTFDEDREKEEAEKRKRDEEDEKNLW
jgi:predicted P-loop ATPase